MAIIVVSWSLLGGSNARSERQTRNAERQIARDLAVLTYRTSARTGLIVGSHQAMRCSFADCDGCAVVIVEAS